MAMSLNRAQIIGNVTRDPEVRQIPGGQSVATFGVATNFRWKNSAGELQNKAEFHNIVAWRKLAEICSQYLRKGSKVYIEGRIQTRDWQGEDGVKRYRTEIVADNMIMLDKKGDFPEGGMNREAAGIEVKRGAQLPGESEVPEMEAAEEVKIDDLPF